MGVSRRPRPPNIVNGEVVPEYIDIADMAIERVRSFKYLGSHVTEGNEMDTEVNYRIQTANKCYYSLQTLMKSRGISMRTKLRTYNSIIKPIVLYGCETWALTQRQESRLLVFENTILRRILGPIFDPDEGWRIRHNHAIRAITGQPLITDAVKSHRLRWAGHVARMADDRMPKIALDALMPGNRPRGRPKKRWEDCLKESIRERGQDPTRWRDAAQDRRQWRRLSAAAMGPGAARQPPE